MVGFDFLSPLLELSAAILGFIYVYLIATEKSIGWFFGIISAFLYAIFFYRMDTWGLFSQQIAYIILGFYGLFTWSDQKEALPVRSIGFSVWRWILISLILGLIFALVIKLVGASKNNSVIVPNSREILDAQFFIYSLLATWLTTRKVLENWLVWIVVNIVGVIWFCTEHWWSTAILYFAYLLLAFNGFRKWKKQLSA
ncbi:MAG: nicotinamide riboside transporter PnuC [Crocinitomicaceae bacterium]|jgi:nicotinamide mononucleotide transporter|nr:nicotinamide riboside transporter PnuC [Crocinitomicaceae bacterium]MDP4723360.1 nicotinamide riboside transporter PnuC [Crocinitomicaceae bacterium]MDP4740184.1 nicotinamide riboside transporter PnuC [Crocinitomicaceae bacterium]MDP4807325.1 nicotinamide riboside transporter PnuC [Crocinitomicaceae bacterium]MDP4868881.1 nicotinamide riboside transporter PnuC [Crocinitomicaceae bacterium]